MAGRAFWEVVPKHLFDTTDGAERLLDHVIATNSSSLSGSPLVYNTVVSGEALTINPDYPNGPPFLAIDGSAPTNLHHTGPSQTANFPLIDVRQVDASYQLANVHYACGTGDGRLIVYSPTLDQQLVIDSTDSQNPLRNEAGTLINPCPGLLGIPSP